MTEKKVVWHPKAHDILLKHHCLVDVTFKKSILGSLGIDYFSLNVINPNGIMTTFSSALAYESNLMNSGLFGLDGILDPSNYIKDNFIFWDALYPKHLKTKLIQVKERYGNFLFGFYLLKPMGNLLVIYSFATRTINDREKYRNSKGILSEIGDYFLNELKEVYQIDITPPPLLPTNERKLQLVVNNT